MLPSPLNEAITLELLDLRHAEELFALTDANRSHLRVWLPWVDRTRSADDTREFIRQTQRQWAENNGFQAAILEHGAIIGVIGLHGVNWANRSTSIGYWLSGRAQGRGVMTTACRAFTRHAFEALSLNRVEIRCATENGRSRAIPERLRFTSEGTLREAEWLYDHFVDHVVYGMLASEWRPSAA
ncbi:MAG: GNAT family N-acetyltransferase [Acidimicrobiia bacterium]|nr:GNAT family N-acetyltransferase [Acidimicrobiia bacterium]